MFTAVSLEVDLGITTRDRKAWPRQYRRPTRRFSQLALLLGCGLLSAALTAAEPVRNGVPPKRSDVERVLSQADGQRQSRPPDRPLTIVLVADQKDHGALEHDYPRWQSRWALLLGGSAASAEKAANLAGPDLPDPAARKGAPNDRVLSAQQWPDSKQWETADLIVAFCYLAWSAPRIEQVRQYVDRGGGLVLIHSATWTKPNPSPDVAGVCGVGGFQRWRHGVVTLEMTKPDHPILLGVPATISLQDETYWPPTPAIDSQQVQVLAGSQEQTHAGQEGVSLQPMFWTYERGRGRVFGCVLGHYSATFDHPYFRLVLLRGMAWAARENPYRFDELVLRSAVVAEQ
jgi:type 1 glutamine amidotransferase